MSTVTFKKNEKEIILMAIFLDKLKDLGRRFTTTEEDYWWTVRIEMGY